MALICCLVQLYKAFDKVRCKKMEQVVVEVSNKAIWHAVLLGGPILIIALVVGLIISILQAVTSIQEQTLTFIPKIFAVAAALWILGPFMMQTMSDFARELFINLPNYIK